MSGIIKSITYKPKSITEPDPAVGYTRVSVDAARLIEGYGIENDRKGGSPKRQLNVMDDITLAELAAEGFKTDPGVLGENMVISGIDLRTLPAGSCLRLGTDAVIELGKPRTGCEQLETVEKGIVTNTAGRIGIMCRVVKSGNIRVGDSVAMIEAESVKSVEA
jgi:MOSC domain-containing protein YiiM